MLCAVPLTYLSLTRRFFMTRCLPSDSVGPTDDFLFAVFTGASLDNLAMHSLDYNFLRRTAT